MLTLPATCMSDAAELVVLVDDSGAPIGAELKSLVHHFETPLHLAFSLYLFDGADRLLMTRRALTKVTWPGVWTNSCCGHPQPGESMTDAIARRLETELGVQVKNLECVLPHFAYRTRDVSGIWENEICPVYTGVISHPEQQLRPNPAEVMDWAWTDWDAAVSATVHTPFAFSPWAVDQVSQLTGSTRSATTRSPAAGEGAA